MSLLLNGWTLVMTLAMTPFSELRGAIITGIGIGLNPMLVFWVAVVFNTILFFPIFFGLKIFYRGLLSRIKIIEQIVNNSRAKIEPYVKKYGPLGMIIFVGIPFPFSGVWTASIAAWILGMEWKNAAVSVAIGVMISGIIILSGTLGFIRIFG